MQQPAVNIRRAGPSDAATFAEHRAAVWQEASDWDSAVLMPQIPVWRQFFAAALADGTYAGWLAESERGIVAGGGILVFGAIPRPGLDSARAGRVHSVYVRPDARRAGIARALMREIIAFAREERLIEIILHPSAAGRSLYAQLGFVPADVMALSLIAPPQHRT